jgi:GT2 family glycosyltransferase
VSRVVGRTVPGNRWDLLDGQWPEEPPTVTVVVTHYEQQAELDRTLAGLARQTHPADRLEVVVVDDGSTEPPTLPDGVLLLRQEDRGFRAAAARNLGARAATGDVLCFLDADTTPEPDYVRLLTRLPALAPEAVTVGRREHADLRGCDPGAPVEEVAPPRRLEAPSWLAGAYRDTADLLHADHRSYRFVISAVLSCSRWFFDEVGGFDASLTSYGGEDWEWAVRAWDAGAVLAHEPAAVAWHDGPDWAARTSAADRLPTKNAETLALLGRHSLPAARPRALRLAPGDVEVRLGSTASTAALLVTVDALLDALPHARVRVPPGSEGLAALDDRVHVAGHGHPARVVVDHAADVVVDPAGLRAALAGLDDEQLGTLLLLDAAGRQVASVSSTRARARAGRWGRDDLFPTATRVVAAHDVPAQPDLEAYVGGWA